MGSISDILMADDIPTLNAVLAAKLYDLPGLTIV